MRHLLILLCSTISYVSSFGQQGHAAHWFFGHKAGIDFSTGIAAPGTSGELVSIEGSASLSDEQGNLLFYTNGVTVWNKDHEVMMNGNDLFGNESSTQSSLIVPMPGSDSLYYLFTTSYMSYQGTRYSIIDMTLDNGKGGVIAAKKNILLNATASGGEAIAATLHCDGERYWVISYEHVGNLMKLHSHLLDETGISLVNTYEMFANANFALIVAHLTISPDGSKVVFSNFTERLFLFDLDKRSGMLTLTETIDMTSGTMIYSTAISADNSKLYLVSWKAQENEYVAQYDMTATDIAASRTVLFSKPFNGSPNGYGLTGQIRLAPDGKMYISRWDQTLLVWPYYSHDSLDVINYPDAAGLACGFQLNGFYLGGNDGVTMIGLPNFVSNFLVAQSNVPPCNYIKIVPPFGGPMCSNDSLLVHYVVNDTLGTGNVFTVHLSDTNGNFNSYQVVGSISSNVSGYIPCWIGNVPNSAYYRLRIVSTAAPDTSTPSPYIEIYHPVVYVSPSLSLCEGDTIMLHGTYSHSGQVQWTGPGNFSSYNTDAVIPAATGANTGTYFFTASVYGCTAVDSVEVVIHGIPETPEIDEAGDVCVGNDVRLQLSELTGNYGYIWQGSNGYHDTSISVHLTNVTLSDSGTYWVVATNGQCYSVADTTLLTVIPLPEITAYRQEPIQAGKIVKLFCEGGAPGCTYTWSGPNGFYSNEKNPVIESFSSKYEGEYKVICDCNGCADTANITLDATPDKAGSDTCYLYIRPNPTSGKFRMTVCTNSDEECPYNIINSLGQSVLYGTGKPENLYLDEWVDISSLADGMYYIRLKANSRIMRAKVLLGKK